MSAFISGISLVCFSASYAVTLALELTRLLFRAPVRLAVMVAFSGAGLIAHSLYLFALAREQDRVAPLSSWYDWCLVAAWVIAAVYIALMVRRPQHSVGLFLLPLVLALIGLAAGVRDLAPFDRQQAVDYWGMLHGAALLAGTVTVALGFAAGVMYLIQAWQLKSKVAPRRRVRLPSLEWLQLCNRRALLISTGLLAAGLLSGIVLNAAHQGANDVPTVPWSDPVVWSSGILFLWLTLVAVFESVYKPARQGRKVAYLTLASFVFLGLALGFVLVGAHASDDDDQPASTWSAPLEGSRGRLL